MTDSTPAAAPFPLDRPNPFDPSVELGRLRQEEPVSRLAYPDGHVGWLVTSHSLIRAVLADERFSSKAEIKHTPVARASVSDEPRPAPPGFFVANDPPEHTRYRHLLTGQFTVRRMRELTPLIQQCTHTCLEEMAWQGPPTDLVQAFALPLPSLVICELLGVPYEDRAEFQRHSASLARVGASQEETVAAYMALTSFMRELVLAKRARPADDLISGLTGSDLTDEELTNIGFMLLGAGHETTANMIALGTFALLSNPDQIAVMRKEPERAVEELLRYLSVVPFTVRTALEDVELAGRHIKAGESVTVSIAAGNRDPERFADPDTLDLLRSSSSQIAFGHGIHQCLGQQLARIEMQIAYPALFDRFPSLRLDVPPEEVPLRADMLIHGVHRLPVTWDI
ncbi:cytochrome P450 [Nonomuraea sp. NPDC046802]|uniref:cytochrome P450 n=1 Tax=Nonomuraea sp. NPDC046802 TaxID=3154919 RepID=UPI0033D0AFCA